MYSDEELKEEATCILQKVELKYGVDEAEVFVQDLSQLWGGTEFRTPKLFQSVERAGCAIRFIRDGKLYFSCFPLASALDDIENLPFSQLTGIPVSHFEFPDISQSLVSDLKIFDSRIASQDEQLLLDYGIRIKEMSDQKKDFIIDSTILFSLERKVIINTSYSLAFEKSTWFDLFLRVLYHSTDMVTSSESNLSTRQIPFSIESFIEKTMHEAIQRASSTSVGHSPKFLLPVIFSPQAFSDIFSFSFVPLLRKRMNEKLNDIEFDSRFTLVDDGTVPGLPNTTAIDDEGVPQSRTEIIKHGDFIHALNDSQHLDFGSEERTGNAFRVKHYELFPRSYQSYPEIYPSNLIISSGNEQIGEIMDDISEGIFLNRIQGQMTADYNTGQFRVSSIDAYLIENGSIRGSLPSVAVIGNIFDILSASPRFSLDRQSVRPTLTPYSILSPYVMTEVVSVFP